MEAVVVAEVVTALSGTIAKAEAIPALPEVLADKCT